MQLKLTYRALVIAANGLREISQADLPIGKAFAIAKVLVAVTKELEAYEKIVEQLKKKHAPDGKFSEEVAVKLETELAEILGQEITMEVEPVDIRELADDKNLKLKPGPLTATKDFLVF